MNRFHLYSRSAGAITRRDIAHPRADQGEVEGMDPDLVLLRVEASTAPEFDSVTQKVEQTEIINLENKICEIRWSVVPLSQDQIFFKLASAEKKPDGSYSRRAFT